MAAKSSGTTDMTIFEALREGIPIPATIAPDRPIREGLQMMKRHAVTVLAVVAEDGAYLGLLSEREVVSGLAGDGVQLLGRPVRSLMLSEGPVALPHDALASVRATMAARRASHIAVIADGHLLTILSIDDVTAMAGRAAPPALPQEQRDVEQRTL
jgi:CBS domain-containing protein